jgi:hypothetical protein
MKIGLRTTRTRKIERGADLTEREIKLKVIDNAEKIARILNKHRDCEVRIVRDNLTIAEVTKRVVIK